MSSTAVLARVPLLARLSDEERATLAGAMTTKTYNTDVDIIVQGDAGNGFFIIQEGVVKVTRVDRRSGASSQLALLKAGDYFGEAALLNSAPRGATITATEPVRCLYLDSRSFTNLFSRSKLNIKFAKRKGISAEKTNPHFQHVLSPNAIKQKDAKLQALIASAVHHNILFLDLTAEQKRSVIAEMYRLEVKSGTSVITQGEVGDNLYVVQTGEFDIFVGNRKVTQRGPGSYFGELALLYNSPRAATVTATSDAVLWAVDRFTFRRIVTGLTKQKLNAHVSFLNQCDILSPLADYERVKLAEALEEVSVRANEVLFRQGDRGDSMYIVQEGELMVTKVDRDNSSGRPQARDVSILMKGSYFGERALLKQTRRAATVTARTNGVVLKLDASAFALLLGPLEEIMKSGMEKYERPSAELERELKEQEEKKSRQLAPSTNLRLEDLVLIGTLGTGSFGHVTLREHKDTKQTYALKAVSKKVVEDMGQQEHIISEKKVMQQLQHPFLVRLYQTFQDRDLLYFLLEPVLGGELFSLLRRKAQFTEPEAQFYAASTVLAFEYMHSKDIIYRDLKPENMLLDSKGFLRITDFGFAKHIGSGTTYTLCGTPDYLAPEIILGHAHGKGVDWWTTGILIFEMLASFPPFTDSEDPMKTYGYIVVGELNFPSSIGMNARSLISKLLHTKPSRRLGVTNGGSKLIKSHPWFRSINFDELLAKNVRTPFVPEIANTKDLTNYEDAAPPEEDIERYDGPADGVDWAVDF